MYEALKHNLIFDCDGLHVMLISVILLWLEYGRILAQSGHTNVTAILMSRSILAQFSFVLSRLCQPNFRHDLSCSILAGYPAESVEKPSRCIGSFLGSLG